MFPVNVGEGKLVVTGPVCVYKASSLGILLAFFKFRLKANSKRLVNTHEKW